MKRLPESSSLNTGKNCIVSLHLRMPYYFYPGYLAKRIMIFCMAACMAFAARGQETSFDADRINLAVEIRDQIYSAFVNNEAELLKKFPEISFTKGAVFNSPIPENYVTKTALVRFRVHNSGREPKQLYFFPGFYYKKIRLYRISGNALQLLPEILPEGRERSGCI